MKKTLKQEIQGNLSLDAKAEMKKIATLAVTTTTNGTSNNGSASMDEVNFKYLKHVIFKFLTSRESEARLLIKAVSTLLHLSHDEERILNDTLTWKMSWFGSKPDHGTGQRAFSIPPS